MERLPGMEDFGDWVERYDTDQFTALDNYWMLVDECPSHPYTILRFLYKDRAYCLYENLSASCEELDGSIFYSDEYESDEEFLQDRIWHGETMEEILKSLSSEVFVWNPEERKQWEEKKKQFQKNQEKKSL